MDRGKGLGLEPEPEPEPEIGLTLEIGLAFRARWWGWWGLELTQGWEWRCQRGCQPRERRRWEWKKAGW